MSRQVSFQGSPIWGGPPPPPGGAPAVSAKSILWQESPTTILLNLFRVPLSTTQQMVSSLTLFADQGNFGTVNLGNSNVGPAASGTGINFQLAPGRSATIYTDDWEKEVFDLSKWFAFPDYDASINTGRLYLTSWFPVVIR